MLDRFLSPVGFGITLICFLLTFCEIKCGNKSVVAISGVNMALGTDPEFKGLLADEDLSLDDAEEMIDGETSGDRNIYASIAFFASIAGLVLFFILGRNIYSPIGLVAGLGAAACLVLLQFDLGKDLDEEDLKLVSFEWQPAYWVALTASFLAGISNLRRVRR
ncbi:MAG: hypothetical protein GYB31_08435 [Bacteroidetes bacterium]|nr:hypothetical protein [Bacteroidota bacterium]